MSNAPNLIVTGLVITIMMVAGTAVVGEIQSGERGFESFHDDVALLGDTGEFETINDGAGYNETVRNSRGYAVKLTGADDSYVKSKSSVSVASDDTWTVSTWAQVNDSAAAVTQTAVSINGRVLINYNGTRGEWVAWYYDDGSTNSYSVAVSAPNQPGNLTNVMVRSNATHFTIYRNNTEGGSADISTENIADAPVESQNWNGKLDETRTDDDALNQSQRQQLVDSPVSPLTGTNRTSRIMYDEPNAGSQSIFFTGTRLGQSNVTFGDGLDGKVMDPSTTMNDLAGDSDYEWQDDGPAIKPLVGGELAGAPVAYVEYEFDTALSSVKYAWTDFVGMAALLPLLLIAVFIISRVS